MCGRQMGSAPRMLVCMRTTLNLPDALVQQSKQRAAREGRTFTSLVEEGLRRLLAEPATDGPVHLPAHGTGRGRVLVDLHDRDAVEAALDAHRT